MVDRGQNIVEDQEIAAPVETARERHPLPLSAGEHDAAFTDHRLEAVRERFEIGPQCRHFDSALNMRFIGRRLEADIGGDGI